VSVGLTVAVIGQSRHARPFDEGGRREVRVPPVIVVVDVRAPELTDRTLRSPVATLSGRRARSCWRVAERSRLEHVPSLRAHVPAHRVGRSGSRPRRSVFRRPCRTRERRAIVRTRRWRRSPGLRPRELGAEQGRRNVLWTSYVPAEVGPSSGGTLHARLLRRRRDRERRQPGERRAPPPQHQRARTPPRSGPARSSSWARCDGGRPSRR
jgi:hypothetical protein